MMSLLVDDKLSMLTNTKIRRTKILLRQRSNSMSRLRKSTICDSQYKEENSSCKKCATGWNCGSKNTCQIHCDVLFKGCLNKIIFFNPFGIGQTYFICVCT